MGLFSVNTDELSWFERDIIRSDRALDREITHGDKVAAGKNAAAMRRRAPKKSGYLASSIRASKGTIEIGAIYAGVINFGWPEHNIEPQEFIFSTIQSSSKEWMKDYDIAGGKALRFISLGGRIV